MRQRMCGPQDGGRSRRDAVGAGYAGRHSVPAWVRAAVAVLVTGAALLALNGCQEASSKSVLPGRDDHGDTRADATLVTAGEPMTGRLERADDVDYFRVAVDEDSVRIIAATDDAAAERPVVRIEDLDTEATNDGHVAWANLPSPRPEYVHIRVTGNRPIDYTLAVSLVAAGDPAAGDGFDIELRYLGAEPTAAQKLAFESAARFWEAAIVTGLPDLPVPTSDWKCRQDDPSLFGEYIDDLLIFVRVEELGDPAGVVAQSTICARRAEADGGLPFIGAMAFNAADMETLETHSYLERMAMRQIAVVLGFGLLWDESQFALLRDPSVGSDGIAMPERDTHFAGDQSVAAFAEVRGDYIGAAVPVENDTGRYGPGALDLHWRESVFGSELMTTVLDAADAPVSRVTIASLADLGYEVDYDRAEPFALPASRDHPPAGEREALRVAGSGVRRQAITATLPAGLVGSVDRGAAAR